MQCSQNGWPAGDESLIGSHPIPGTDIHLRLRNGDAATVLLYVAAQIHKRVEKLNPQGKQWCWGYNFRLVRGSSVFISNHGSGTAIDLNAPAHGRGTRGTWSPLKKWKIRRILKPLKGAVVWGEDFSGTIDGMHFELCDDRACVAAAATWIRNNEEDKVTPADKADIAKLVMKQPVPNKGTGKNFTLQGVLENIENDGDRAVQLAAESAAQIATLTKLVEDLTTNVARLLAQVPATGKHG